MRLLLDTHVLLWWLADDRSLSHQARRSIGEVNSVVFVSTASLWEISIKKASGKLRVPDNLESELSSNEFASLPVVASHAFAIAQLPNHHRDPFDRMLVVQAMLEDLTLVTRDENIAKYEVATLLA